MGVCCIFFDIDAMLFEFFVKTIIYFLEKFLHCNSKMHYCISRHFAGMCTMSWTVFFYIEGMLFEFFIKIFIFYLFFLLISCFLCIFVI